MRIVDQVTAWLIIAMGAMHLAFTRRAYPEFSLQTLWFISAGLLMIFMAALNLLRIRYAAVAPGVRSVCIVANFVTLVWAAAFAFAVSLTQAPQVLVSTALMALLTIFSILRRPAHL